MKKFLLTTALMALPFVPAQAQSEDPILSLPDGQVILNISATERQEVDQDLLVANLEYTAEETDARAVQNEINSAMAKAVARAKKVDNVEVNTGSYNVYERTDPRSDTRKWYGQQSLVLKSNDSEAVLTLVGDLQDMGLKMNNLNYVLDPDTSVSLQDSLLEDAISQLQSRADRVARAMGKSSAEIREIDTQSDVPRPQPMYRANMAMSVESGDSMAPPVAEAGKETITMTVNGRVILMP